MFKKCPHQVSCESEAFPQFGMNKCLDVLPSEDPHFALRVTICETDELQMASCVEVTNTRTRCTPECHVTDQRVLSRVLLDLHIT